jgi:hypothetical protein
MNELFQTVGSTQLQTLASAPAERKRNFEGDENHGFGFDGYVSR